MDAPLQQQELADEQTLTVYRLVHTDERTPEALAPSFRSRKEQGKDPLGREVSHPEVWEGCSAFKTLEGARDLWKRISARQSRRGGDVALGDHVAEVRLEGGHGFSFEDLRSVTGHVTIWGEPLELARHVTDIHPAFTQERDT